MVSATVANEVGNLSNNMLFALQNFALKEYKLELKCHD